MARFDLSVYMCVKLNSGILISFSYLVTDWREKETKDLQTLSSSFPSNEVLGNHIRKDIIIDQDNTLIHYVSHNMCKCFNLAFSFLVKEIPCCCESYCSLHS